MQEMQKELYKLILVFIMISFSFALAFFIGREVTLAGQKNPAEKKLTVLPKPKKASNKDLTQNAELKDVKGMSTAAEMTEHTGATEHAEITEHTETAEHTGATKHIETKLHRKNTVLESKKLIRKAPIIYGLFIAKFLKKEQAMNYATNIKLSFPNWRIFVKRASLSEYAVYVGPFQKKEAAKAFLNEIPDKKKFPSIRIEKIIVKKSKKKSSE